MKTKKIILIVAILLGLYFIYNSCFTYENFDPPSSTIFKIGNQFLEVGTTAGTGGCLSNSLVSNGGTQIKIIKSGDTVILKAYNKILGYQLQNKQYIVCFYKGNYSATDDTIKFAFTALPDKTYALKTAVKENGVYNNYYVIIDATGQMTLQQSTLTDPSSLPGLMKISL